MEGKLTKCICTIKNVDAEFVLRGKLSAEGDIFEGLGFSLNVVDNRLSMSGNEFEVLSSRVESTTPRLVAKKTAKVPIDKFDDDGNKCVKLLPTSYADKFTSWLTKNYEKSDGKCIQYTDIISVFAEDNGLHITNKGKIGAKSVVTKAVNKTFNMSASCNDGYPLRRKDSK